MHTAVLLGQLESRQVISVSAALDGQSEADIEDLMPPEFYVELVKAAFSRSAAAGLTAEALDGNGNPRLSKRVQAILEGWGFNGFDHLLPAIELSKNPEQYAVPHTVLDRAEALAKVINSCLEAQPAPKARSAPKKAATRAN